MRQVRIPAVLTLLVLSLGWVSAAAASYHTIHTHTGFGALFVLAADHRGNVYVADQKHHTILELSSSGRQLRKDKMPACGISGLAVSRSDEVYAVAACQGQVIHFSQSGKLLRMFGVFSLFHLANGVAVSDGGAVFVTYSSPVGPPVKRGKRRSGHKGRPPLPPNLRAASVIRQFTSNGKLQRTVTLPGIYEAWGIAVGKSGDLYVTSSEGLLEVSPRGRIVRRWKQAAPPPSVLPGQPAVDVHGDAYVGDRAGGILKISPNGRIVGEIVRHGSRASDVQQPAGLTIDGGYLFVADEGTNRIKAFSLSGKLIAIWTP